MATDNFDTEIDDIGVNSLEGVLDDSGVFRLRTPNISSYNFDGAIGSQRLNIAASAVQPGMQISLTGSADVQTYYTVLFINNDDEELSASPSKLVTIQYLDEDAFPQILSIGASVTLFAQIEDWDNKYIGENGWYIGTSGNAIFSNVAIRGEIEATTMDIGGAEGIIYDGNTVTIGASVIINAALTVGASGNFIVSGSAAQDIISNNTTITGGNIATGKIKSTGYSGPGTASAFSTSGMLINLDDGSISSNNFRIDDLGNAFFQGSINATSGSFSGWVKSASITGGIITSGSFVGGVVQSSGYSGVFDGSGFSTTGTHINLNTGAITGKQFRIDSSGNAVFAGSLSAATGTFSGTLSANSITSGTLNASIVSVTNLNASNITTGTLSGRLLQTSGYSGVTDGSAFSSLGTMAINLSNGTITAPGFRINSSGAFFQGDITGSNGTFSGTVSANNVTAGTLTGSTFKSSAGITATSGNGVYLDASGNVRFATTSASLQFNSGGLTVGGGTISGALINGGLINGVSITGGTISGQSGNIGGFTIGANSLTAGSSPNIVGISTTSNSFFAGATSTTGTGAKFNVTSGGVLTATGATISGAITATSGYFGNSTYGMSINDNTGTGEVTVSLGTLRLGSKLSSGVLHGSLDIYNTSGSRIGQVASSQSSKDWSGLGSGVIVGTNTDYMFLPSSGNSTKPRIYGSGIEFWQTGAPSYALALSGTSFNIARDLNVQSGYVYKTNGNTFINSSRALTVDGITNQSNGITNNGGQITSSPTRLNSVTGATREVVYISSAGVLGTNVSTYNFKHDITPIDGNLLKITIPEERLNNSKPYNFNYKKILDLTPVLFRWDEDNSEEVGLIAEEVGEIFPIAYSDYENPSYNRDMIFISMLSVIKDQQKEINQLQDRLKIIEERLEL